MIDNIEIYKIIDNMVTIDNICWIIPHTNCSIDTNSPYELSNMRVHTNYPTYQTIRIRQCLTSHCYSWPVHGQSVFRL